MARRICSPACPVSSSTCACSSLHTSAIGNGTCTSNSCPRTTSNLGLDLWSLLWYLFLTAALSFKKGFSTRTLSEFGREPLLPFLRFQLKVGHPPSLSSTRRDLRLARYQDLLLTPESLAEEIPGFPGRPLRILRDIIANQKINLHELDGGVEIERLVHIVRRRMVTCGDPIIIEFLGIEGGISGFLSFG